MSCRDDLARVHRSVVSDFIEVVVEEWAGDRSVLEQNLLGSLLRSELESRLVPELTAVLTLLLETDSQMLGGVLPEWLDLTSTAMPAEAAFLTEMGRLVDPVGSGLLEESCCLLPGESLDAQAFRCHLLEMAPMVARSLPGG